MLSFLGSAQELDLSYYGVRDGLPQSTVTALFKDSRGLLWIGTEGGGVATFDGSNIKTYAEEEGLDGKIVRCITEDRSGHVIIGSSWGGMSIFDGDRFNPMEMDSKLLPGIQSFHWIGDSLFIGTTRGLIVYYDGDFLPYSLRELNSKAVVDIDYDKETDTMYVATHYNIYKIAEQRVAKTYVCETTIQTIKYGDQSQLFVGTRNGLYILDETDLFVIGLEDESIHDLHYTEKGELWIGGNSVRLFFGGYHQTLGRENGLSSGHTNSLLEDGNGNLWIGTDGGGLILWKRNGFSYFERSEALGAADLFALCDYDGYLWASEIDKGLHGYAPDKELRFISNTLFNNGLVHDLFNDGDQMLIGTRQGLFALRGNQVVDLNSRFFEEPVYVRSILRDSKGVLWLGVSGEGIFRFDAQNRPLPAIPEIEAQFIHDIFEDSQGRIWVGTGNGAFVIDDGSLTHVRDELCNSYVGSIEEDELGRIWLGTDRCVAILSDTGITTLDYSNGLNSSTIYLMVHDQKGEMYVGTNAGLNRIRLKENGEILKIDHLGPNEGFRGMECNSRSSLRSEDGSLYFGTIYGLVKLNKGDRHQTPTPPKIYLEGIELSLREPDWKAKGFEVDWYGVPRKLDLDHDDNHLSFVFGAIDFVSGDDIQYTYMLDGFDEEWSPPSKYSKAIYANLPPGTYTFMLKAVNSAEQWSSVLSHGPITIAQPPPPPAPLYQRWWFYLLISLPILLILYYLIVIRTRQLAVSKRELQRAVDDQTSEIRRQNDEKEVMLKEIHHRVKNNLQIINSLLNLQSQYVTDQESLKSFEECKNRISSMALIHERMYETQDLARINFREYAHDLARNLISVYAVGKSIDLHINVREEAFKIDTLVPLGLILNEVISNSLKYAFTETDGGEVLIELQESDTDRFILKMGDNGKGLPPDFDWRNSDSLGLQLIQILSDQIDGQLEMRSDQGTHYTLKFSRPT